MGNYPFDILYEDNHLMIVNKESGTLVQGDSTGDKPLVEHVRDYIKEAYQKPGNVFCGVIHRLDRPVSGAICFAKTSKGLERMNKLLRDKKLYKTYWAVVKRRPKEMEGRLVHWIKKNNDKNIVKAYDKEVQGSQKATLTYKVLGKLNDHWLIEVKPITGRSHQIRVQLASMGCPIRGDVKYGFHKPNTDASINLHARRIDFEHPIKKESMLVVAPVPSEPFWEQFLTLDELKEKHIKKITKDV